MVNLEWYRTFVAIYQQGNLTRAAEELFISQPNVSVQLASLENHVGHKLFDRMPRKLVPTEYGKRLYTQVVGSIESLTEVETSFHRNVISKTRTIKLGSPIEYFYNDVVDMLTRAKSDLYLKFGLAPDLINKLEKGELNLVLATMKIDKPGIVYEKIVEENFILVARPSFNASTFHALMAAKDIQGGEKWLREQEWVAYDNKLSLIRRFWRNNFDVRPMIKPRFVIPDINSIAKTISLGNGIGVVSDLVCKQYIKQGLIKPIWAGRKPSVNTLYLAYFPEKVDKELVDEMKNILKI